MGVHIVVAPWHRRLASTRLARIRTTGHGVSATCPQKRGVNRRCDPAGYLLRMPCKAGPLCGNHFLTIVEGLENVRPLGRMTLWEGAQPIRFALAD